MVELSNLDFLEGSNHYHYIHEQHIYTLYILAQTLCSVHKSHHPSLKLFIEVGCRRLVLSPAPTCVYPDGVWLFKLNNWAYLDWKKIKKVMVTY